MLAVAQGLVRRPRLMMLDEPSAGLSPVLVDRVLGVVSALRAKGTSVLLVEQLIEKALAVSDRVYAMAQGNIALEAQADEPHLPHRLERTYFGGELPMHCTLTKIGAGKSDGWSAGLPFRELAAARRVRDSQE